MRVLDGEQILVRIFIGESDKWHHQPLHVALLERLRKQGFAGATARTRISMSHQREPGTKRLGRLGTVGFLLLTFISLVI